MALDFECQFYDDNVSFICGVDEAGRGCLLGDVFAGAVILPKGFKCELINDSKKLSEKQRERAFEIIKEYAIAYGVGRCTPEEIDEINIYNAARKAMIRAIENMNHNFDILITDCMNIDCYDVRCFSLIKGDAKAQCVAAASILAKVSRDHYCDELDQKYPQYQIKKHKGYPTKLHLDLLKKYGPIKELYRYSYAPVKKCIYKAEQTKLF